MSVVLDSDVLIDVLGGIPAARDFLKDLSSLGTSIDGVPVPSSIEVVEGRKRDVGVEVPLPSRARIGLANVIVLDFESAVTP